MDATGILVSNLLEAFKQINTYVTLGLVAAVSAAALERRGGAPTSTEAVQLLGGFPALPRETAQLLLIGIGFVAGVMASYSAEAAEHIVRELHDRPDLLKAACTYASVATAPVAVPIIAATLPIVFAGLVIHRKARAARELSILSLLMVFLLPYVVIALILGRLPCRAS